jgi:hypothetical protein
MKKKNNNAKFGVNLLLSRMLRNTVFGKHTHYNTNTRKSLARASRYTSSLIETVLGPETSRALARYVWAQNSLSFIWRILQVPALSSL